MANDSDIFGSGGSTKPVDDSAIFKDIEDHKPIQAVQLAPASSTSGYADMLKQGAFSVAKGLITGGPTGAAVAGAGEAMKNIPVIADYAGGKVTDLAAGHMPPEAAAALGTVANVGVQAAPMLIPGGQSTKLTAQDEARNALLKQKASILEKGKDLGFKVPPSQVNPSFQNLLLEGLGGKSATAQKASAVNEEVAYGLAQKAAGLKPTESINLETLAAARERMAQPYRDLAALESVGPLSKPPFKSPADTLEELKLARNDAKQHWAHYNRSQDPAVLQKAQAASAKSDQLEAALEAQASDAGRPELAQALKDARVALAKNYTVQRAMRGSNFDPSALSRLESRGKTPLSDDLETIMQMYRDYPKAMAAPQVGGSVGVHQLMPWIGGSSGGAIGAILGGPLGAAAGSTAGMVLSQGIPPLARSLILSRPYQEAMANFTPKTAPALSPTELKNAAYAALLMRGALSQ